MNLLRLAEQSRPGRLRPVDRFAQARVSRRRFLQRGAVTAGGLAGLSLLGSPAAFGRPIGAPRPIPGGFDDTFTPVPSDPLIHVLPPAVGFEMATITDFNGVVGASEIQGTASGSDGTHYSFDTDMRFMQGTFIALDGRIYEGAFGFV